LNDGLNGSNNYKTGRWLGFQGKDIDAIIDLQKPTTISEASFQTNVVKGDWIMGAKKIIVKVSDDGENFTDIATKDIPSISEEYKDGLYLNKIEFEPVKTRYVNVIISGDTLPEWHKGAGSAAFIFVDEINIK
jgi:hexosaminidase